DRHHPIDQHGVHLVHLWRRRHLRTPVPPADGLAGRTVPSPDRVEGRGSMNWHRANRHGVALLVVAAAAFPLAASSSAITVMALAGLFAMVAIGLNLLVGYAGKISFGHNAFMALGAYGTGILTVDYEWSPLAALIASLVGTGIIAFLIGA